MSQTAATWAGLLVAIGVGVAALAAVPTLNEYVKKLLTVGGALVVTGLLVAIVGSIGPSTPAPPPTPQSPTPTPTSTPGVPSADPPPTATVVPTFEPPAAEMFLDEIAGQWVKGPASYQTGSNFVDGMPYPRSLAFPAYCGQYPEVVEFVLSRRYGTFTAVIGLADDSGSNAKVRFEVDADGSNVGGRYDLGLGEHKVIEVDIRNAVKLRLTATNIGACSNYNLENGTAVWGDARVSE